MRRLSLVSFLAAATCALAAPAALAAPPSPANPAGPELGVVPPHNQARPGGGSGSNLSYHNGAVMPTNRTYAIYWQPSGYGLSTNYRSLIDGYLANVAADSGQSSNVYFSDTQYYGPSLAPIAYSSTFGGSVLDTHALPPSGCSDSYTSVCLSDAQIRSEIASVATASGWTVGPTTLIFMFTAQGIGSCYSSGSCAFSSYCAYHSNTTIGATGNVPWANMPYADTVPAACDAGEHPNGDDADATINVTSHEHNEAVTDPLGSAWYDKRGYEDGDKCAWNFGTQLGGASGAQYNQVIGTGRYELQQEWSNATSRCVLTGT